MPAFDEGECKDLCNTYKFPTWGSLVLGKVVLGRFSSNAAISCFETLKTMRAYATETRAAINAIA